MTRPVGYTVIAVLLGLVSASVALGAWTWPTSMQAFHVVVGPLYYILMYGSAAVGLLAAWSVWQYAAPAPEWYAAWAALNLATTAYMATVVMPQILRAVSAMFGPQFPLPQFPPVMIVVQFAFGIGVHALIYWYLATRRRGRARPPGDALVA